MFYFRLNRVSCTKRKEGCKWSWGCLYRFERQLQCCVVLWCRFINWHLQTDLVVHPHYCLPCLFSDRVSLVCYLEETRIELHKDKIDDDGQINHWQFVSEHCTTYVEGQKMHQLDICLKYVQQIRYVVFNQLSY